MSEHHRSGRPKASWGKRIGIIAAALVLLLVVFYFVATSSAFIKAMILPKVGDAMNAKVTAGDVSLSPFSQLHLRQLRVETTGSEPLLTADEVLVRYSLMDIIGGNINVHEITLNSPVITIAAEPDGSSNLDPVLKKDEPEKPESEEPTQLSLKNFSIKNGIVRHIQKGKNGAVDRTELQGVNVTLDQLGNGQSGKLALQSAFSMEQSAGGTNSVLGGNIGGEYDVRLNNELMPDTIKGSSKVTINRATGAHADLNNLNLTLDADLTPQEIRQLALRFAKDNQELGQARVSGPLNLEKMEGNLKVELLSLDKNILALAAAGSGYDFRNSALNSTNQITISQNGSFFSANGSLLGSKISIANQQMTTPEMDLNIVYQLAVNTSDKTALLEKLNILGTAGGNEFLRATLNQQMNLSWGDAVKGYKDAALRLIVTNMNLGDWKALLGTNLHAGIVNANVNLVSQQDGKLLNTEIAGQIANLDATFGSNRISNASASLGTTGTVENLNVINLPRFSAQLNQGGSPVIQATGAVRYQVDAGQATAQINAEGPLARLMIFAGLPDASATAGILKVSANYSDVGTKKKANGQAGVEEFTGKYGDYHFTNFLAGFEYNLEVENDDVEIHRAAAKFAQGFNAGGTIDLKGRYNMAKSSGQFTFKTVDLNQHTFGPILAPSLGENRLVSIALNASGEATLDPQASSAIKADVKVSNWVVQDPAGTLPKTPLSMDLNIDGGMQKELVDLRKLTLQLSPTDRAKNTLNLQAKIDLSKTNPTPSTISLQSESLDVTPYYDLFAATPATNTAASTPTAGATPAPAAQAEPEKEPEPMELPFKQLTAELKLDRFFLRQIAISNWAGTVAIRSNVVQLNPFQMQLNGGPVSVSGNVDVGRPGYAYDLAFRANDVPLAPIANSLELTGSNQLAGTFVADAKIRGAGTTGPNLRKNLGGSATLNLTNLNYHAVGPKLQRILVPISLALRVPELAQTPINWVTAQTHITNGVVQIERAEIESEAFFANLSGPITLADVITNSTLNLPIDLSLRRSLAEKAKILPSNTPPEAKFAKLGNVYTIRGTVGAPDPDANKAVLAGLALQGAAGFGLGDEKTEKALGAIGNILTGQKGASTNAPSTNASPVNNIVRGLGGLLGGAPKTNAPAADPQGKTAPATNAPPTTQQKSSPIGDLLRALPGKKSE